MTTRPSVGATRMEVLGREGATRMEVARMEVTTRHGAGKGRLWGGDKDGGNKDGGAGAMRTEIQERRECSHSQEGLDELACWHNLVITAP